MRFKPGDKVMHLNGKTYLLEKIIYNTLTGKPAAARAWSYKETVETLFGRIEPRRSTRLVVISLDNVKHVAEVENAA